MRYFGATNGIDFFNRQVIHSRRQRQQQRRHHTHVCQRSFPTSFRQASSLQRATTQRQCARHHDDHNAVRRHLHSFPAHIPPLCRPPPVQSPHLLCRYVEIADEAPTDLLSPGTVLQLLPAGSVDGLCIKNITTAQIDSEVGDSCLRFCFRSVACIVFLTNALTLSRLILSPNSASACANALPQCASSGRSKIDRVLCCACV